MDAQRVVDDRQARLAGEELGHAAQHVGAGAGVPGACGLGREQAGSDEPGRHVGEAQLDRLVLVDRHPEGPPFGGVAPGLGEGAGGEADGARGDGDAAELEPVEELAEAGARASAEEIGRATGASSARISTVSTRS